MSDIELEKKKKRPSNVNFKRGYCGKIPDDEICRKVKEAKVKKREMYGDSWN